MEGFDDLKLGSGLGFDVSKLPQSLRTKLEGQARSYMPSSDRQAFFKKNYPAMYEQLKNIKKVGGTRFNKNLACVESLCENHLALKLREGSIQFDAESGAFVPVMEAANTTADIANFLWVQFPLLRKIYFSNMFINLVSVQPARSRSGTYFKMDVQKATTASTTTAGDSVFTKANFDKNYADYTEDGAVRDIKMTLATDTFTTSERALAAEVTDMLQQDLNAEHGMDAFQELMPVLVDELTKTESWLLLDTLLAGSAGFSADLTWNENGYETEDANYTFHKKSYKQTVVDEINNASREIQKNVGKRANWVLMDLDTWGKLENSLENVFKDAYGVSEVRSITGATLDNLGEDNTNHQWMGVLNGRYDVYVDNSGHTGLANKIIVGSTSSQWLYQGLVYIPFILGFAPGRLRSYDNIFKTKEGMLNRSGSKMVNAQFYAQITVTQS